MNSLKTEKTFECNILFIWIIFIMNTTPIHNTFLIKKFQVRSNKYPIFLQGKRAYFFTVLAFMDITINIFLLHHLS